MNSRFRNYSMVWCFASFFSVVQAAANQPMTCSFVHKDISTELKINDEKTAKLNIKDKNSKMICDLEIVQMDDLRDGPVPNIRLYMRRENCHPVLPEILSQLVPELMLDLYQEQMKRKAKISLFKKQGFQTCNLKAYSAEILKLRR